MACAQTCTDARIPTGASQESDQNFCFQTAKTIPETPGREGKHKQNRQTTSHHI